MAPALTLAVEWSNVHLAGAFLLGTLFGTVITLRIMHVVAGLLRKEMQPDDGCDRIHNDKDS